MDRGDLQEQLRRATDVQARYADYLLSKPHVVGLGIGMAQRDGLQTPEVALIVMVNEKFPASELTPDDLIPQELDGVRVDVQETGGFTTLDAQ